MKPINLTPAQLDAALGIEPGVPIDRDTDDVCDGADARPSLESLGGDYDDDPEERDYDPDEDRTP